MKKNLLSLFLLTLLYVIPSFAGNVKSEVTSNPSGEILIQDSFDKTICSERFEIRVAELPAGTYFIHLSSDKSMRVVKFVKK